MSAPEIVAAAREHYRHARWDQAYALLEPALAAAGDPLEAACLKVGLVEVWNWEDLKRGLQSGRDKLALLDEAQADLDEADDRALLARAAFERGMALHAAYLLADAPTDGELACFVSAAELHEAEGDLESAAMALALAGVYHHVVELDRATAQPLLVRAHGLPPQDGAPSLARAEAARHLGQILQELGDHDGSIRFLTESVEIRERAGYPINLPSAYHALAYALLEAGDLAGAAARIAQAREWGERTGSRFPLAMIKRTEADLELAELAPALWRRSHP